jgi:hypothetical protein
MDNVALGQVIVWYFRFHFRLPHTYQHPPSGAGTVGQTVAHVPRGLTLTRRYTRKI